MHWGLHASSIPILGFSPSSAMLALSTDLQHIQRCLSASRYLHGPDASNEALPASCP